MTARNRIPATLESYLAPPPESSLVLLTGTVGCSPNWLTARFAGISLDQTLRPDRTSTAVVFASWSRDGDFWRHEIRRTTGVDTAKHAQAKRFAFIDLLSHRPTQSGPSAALESEAIIQAAIFELSDNGRHAVQLILDGPDVGLATASIRTHELMAVVMRLRSHAHSTVVACGADAPFLAAATLLGPVTPAESEIAAFVVQLAHCALMTMGVHELETGAARDVSGVLRVTRGGGAYGFSGGEGKLGETDGSEALYLVNRDGSVKVLERGVAA